MMVGDVSRREFLKLTEKGVEALGLSTIVPEKLLSTDYSSFFSDEEIRVMKIQQEYWDYSSFVGTTQLSGSAQDVGLFHDSLALEPHDLDGATLEWIAEQHYPDYQNEFIQRRTPEREMISLTLQSGDAYVGYSEQRGKINLTRISDIFPHWESGHRIQCLKGGVVAHVFEGMEDEVTHYEYAYFRDGRFDNVDRSGDNSDNYYTISNSRTLLRCQYEGGMCTIYFIGNEGYKPVVLSSVLRMGPLRDNPLWHYRNCVGAICTNSHDD